VLPGFGDIFQEEGTRLGKGSLTKIDRVYCNLFLSSLFDLEVNSRVAWRHADKFGRASDHVPVSVSLEPVKPTNMKYVVPSWITFHPKFQSLCEQLFSECRIPKDPFRKLELCKSIFKDVAGKIKSYEVEPELASNIYVQTYWCLVAFRRCRVQDAVSVKRALKAYPYLESFFEDGICIDVAGLHQHLADCIVKQATLRRSALEEQTADDPQIIHKMRRLSVWISIWKKRRGAVQVFGNSFGEW